MDVSSLEDRRRKPRIKENFIVICRNCEKNDKATEGYTEDISECGVRILTNKLYSPKDKLLLEIYHTFNVENEDLSSQVTKIISSQVLGEIVWINSINTYKNTSYRVGINFLENYTIDLPFKI